ncbi:MAG TPA: antitoxin MazE family protein [Phenylobacterium sp.]|uniref:antitoxin MazE family protein n=1 Tax=Phenylobacterium sp. TaxID=1871053 RepID=UPI002B486A2E|nr:antitoxin MazE family protein [Phenylobacterium sp.]HKR88719.1 antitoxin MazE family protein [Phenylobacterium sp.]
MQRRRDKLKAAGLRPVQFWVPDTRVAGFNEACARQVALIRASESPESRAFDEAWEEAADTAGWTP